MSYMPTRGVLYDERCRRLVEDILGTKIGVRPVLVRYREACKLYGLAWLLADLVPEDPIWARVVGRFARRAARAATLWEHTTTGVDCAATAELFRSLVFREQCQAVSSHRVVIDELDFKILHRAVALDGRRALLAPRRHGRSGGLTEPASSRAKRDRWAGVLCAKLSTLLLMPVDHMRRPFPGCPVVVTNIRDLRIPDRRQTRGADAAQALERLAQQIQAADPYASGHSILAMQGPLVIAAEELRGKA